MATPVNTFFFPLAAALLLAQAASSQTGKDTTVASLQRQAIAATAMPQKAQPGADSLQKAARAHKLDSLTAEASFQKQRYLKYPASLDSIFNLVSLWPYQMAESDAIGLSEIGRRLPQIVDVPFSLSSSLNRFMMYGFPVLPNATFLDNNAFPDYPNSISGSDGVFTTQIDALLCAAPYGVTAAQLPSGLITPHADILWENGVFGENVLGVRFARPITRNIDVGVFSNYRYFAPYSYATAGDMSSLYSYFITDTSLLVNQGRNPLSDESRTTLRLASHSGRWGTSSLSYSYEDSKNDEAFEAIDTLKKSASLQWQKISKFSNVIQGQVRSFPVYTLSVNADAKAVIGGHNVNIPSINYSLPVQKSGRNSELALRVEPYLPLGSDTLLLPLDANRIDRELYDQSTAISATGDVRAEYRRGFSLHALSAAFKASCGDGIVKAGGKIPRHSLVYAADLSAKAGMQSLHLFAVRDHLPFYLPYDTLDAPLESYFDVYDAFGAEAFLCYKKIGLTTGICAAPWADTAGLERYWPGQMLPYRQPRLSFMVTPLFGRWIGFALSSRLMVSDSKPFFKSQTILDYEAHPLAGKECITVDLIYDYWSDRDRVSFGGITDWNREIDNLSLTTAVHIQSFNLFYKIDNILNRKFAYVPGYFMPGITFRWGFGWLIQ